MENQRHNDREILEQMAALRTDIVEMRKEMNERLAPIDNLKGFWRVIGFVLGGITFIAAGVAGAKYLVGFIIHK